MKTTRILAVAVLIVGSGLALHVAQSQQPGVKRADLLRHDLGVSGREVVQVRVDLAPGVAFPPHSHPGEEIACHVYRRKRQAARRAGSGERPVRQLEATA